MKKVGLKEQIQELKSAQQTAVVDEKIYIADVLLALRRHGKLKGGEWIDSALEVILESLDELDKIEPKAQSKKLFKTVQNSDFNKAENSWLGEPIGGNGHDS